jgi:hypothetical protein
MAAESKEVTLNSSAASNTTLTGYYTSVLVENLTTGTGATIIWARADGVTAVSEADGTFAIDPGQSLVLQNGTIWDQGLLNVPAGSLSGGTPWTPAYNYPYGTALNGAIANPGTVVSVILDTGSGPVQVAISSND